tara:strand:+ start:3403 stop:5271 length:1869 start_codon:yes stop_codon:yes gene_type:complete
MRNIFTTLLFFISISLFSQDQKRLALVIGNANYDKGELKNPVNDARLIASTLDSLDFDVILKENLATKRDMTAAIREFGSKRSEYDVAFVYYAGHGIQVDDENFLLPTKEVFEEEFDVMDYGVSVQNIMRYLRAQTNEVNVLILDACRNNPFESNWNTTRSVKSQGLAKIPPPTGSLIAFSTDSGQTAPDGDGKNSTYTISLAKNMLLEDTSIDQVFRNVRAEVLAETDGIQRPVEATQLTGQTFYLNSYDIDFLCNTIDLNISQNKLDEAINISNFLIYNFPNSNKGYLKRGHIYYFLEKFDLASKDYDKSLEINPYDNEVFYYNIDSDEVGLFNLLFDSPDYSPEKLNLIVDQIKEARVQDSENYFLDYIYIDALYNWLNQPQEAVKIIEEFSIKCSEDVEKSFIKKHNAYTTFDCFTETNLALARVYQTQEDYKNAKIYINKLIENIDKTDYKQIANIYRFAGEIFLGLEDYKLAKNYLNKAISLLPSAITNYINISEIYEIENDYDSSLLWLDKALNISFENNWWLDISYSYYMKANFYERNDKLMSAYSSISNAIKYAKESNNFIYKRSQITKKLLEKFPEESESIQELFCEDLNFICKSGWDKDCSEFKKYCTANE